MTRKWVSENELHRRELEIAEENRRAARSYRAFGDRTLEGGDELAVEDEPHDVERGDWFGDGKYYR